MVGCILGYGRLFFLDRILVISTDFCYFPKMLRRFLKMREKVGMLAVQKCRRHASFKSDHGRLFFYRPFPFAMVGYFPMVV